MAKSSAVIPQFPGLKPPRSSPAPPKFLVVSDGSGEEKKIEVAAMKQEMSLSELHPIKLKRPEVPVVETRFTSMEPAPKVFTQPPHRYKGPVDSRAEGKSTGYSGFPAKVGTSYSNIPNAPSRGYVARPKDPAIPRPFMPLSKASFEGGPALANRTAAGTILGSLSTKRYVDSANVPYLPPEMPLGPDNPSKDIDFTWSAHWDDEAGAVYYYNKITGEATWLPPS